MTETETDLKIDFECEFDDIGFFVNGELAKTFRLYSDNGWELLNKYGNPIMQGRIKSRNTEQSEEKK
jgi:hypothetical protein